METRKIVFAAHGASATYFAAWTGVLSALNPLLGIPFSLLAACNIHGTYHDFKEIEDREKEKSEPPGRDPPNYFLINHMPDYLQEH